MDIFPPGSKNHVKGFTIVEGNHKEEDLKKKKSHQSNFVSWTETENQEKKGPDCGVKKSFARQLPGLS